MRRETYGGSGSAFVKMLRLDSELRITVYTNIDEARAPAERLAQERG
jgi:hypothetical protein